MTGVDAMPAVLTVNGPGEPIRTGSTKLPSRFVRAARDCPPAAEQRDARTGERGNQPSAEPHPVAEARTNRRGEPEPVRGHDDLRGRRLPRRRTPP